MTPLEAAAQAMDRASGDAALRRAFFAELAAAELVVVLAVEAGAGAIEPRVFEVDGHRLALAFDSEAGLASFAEGPVERAIMPGRVLARMLSGAGLGLGLNFGASSAPQILDAAALAWVAEASGTPPGTIEDRPEEIAPPSELPAALLPMLEARIARVGALAREAWLARARYRDGRGAGLLVFVDVEPAAEPAIARSVAEAVAIAGLSEGDLDIAFVASGSEFLRRLATVGLRIALPDPPSSPVNAPPGTDPQRPPRLR